MKNTFIIDIINKCNLFCPYCFWPENNSEIMTKSQILDLVKNKKEDYIVITWWEPLLHNEIWEIIQWIFNLWKKVILHTNWVLLNKDFLEENKKYIYRINLPIDSIDSNINALLRWKIHLENVKKSIYLVNSMWINLSVTSVFTRVNEDYFLKLAEYLKDINIDLWRVFEYKISWKSKDLNLIPNKNKIKSFQNEVKKYNFSRFEFIESDSNFYD